MTHDDEIAAPGPFELSGGVLCLDFANTWGNHTDPASDRLQDYEHLVAFARQTECLTAAVATALCRAASGDRQRSAAALSLAREFRQVIYRIFASLAGGRDVALEDVSRINGVLGEALSHRKIERRDGGFTWSWADDDRNDLRAPIWPVIESVAALLTSGDLARVSECNAPDCNWLFIDRSRSGTRRWCSMKSCGNRAKARRHYRRKSKDGKG